MLQKKPASRKRITEEERERIETLLSYGISSSDVAELTGRNVTTIAHIKAGTYDMYKEKLRKRDALRKQAAESQPVEEAKQEEPTPMFSDDNLQLRIADSNDYTNALLNGILNKLIALCEALGV